MDFYASNLNLLKKHHPDLVGLIEGAQFGENRVEQRCSEGGGPEIVFTRKDGVQILINDVDYQQELPAQVMTVLNNILENEDEKSVVILLGFSLGYCAERLEEIIGPNSMLIVYEASPELFRAVLCMRELNRLLTSERVKIILGEEPDDWGFVYDFHHDIANGRFCMIRRKTCLETNRVAYDRFIKKYQEQKRLVDANVLTCIRIGNLFADTVMTNIPNIIRSAGIKKLKDLFKGRPAIIVSGGPSLEKNFHLLKKAKGRAAIIAVDVVVPTLLPAGIIPDMVVALDPDPILIRVFKDNPLLRIVPLLCVPQFNHETITTYPGPIFMNSLQGNHIYFWLSGFWEDKGFLPSFGGSVAHTAFAAAQYMGADVIALIGQDLSFAEKLHAGEATTLLHDTSTPDFAKGHPIVKDIFGESRHTIPQFLGFKTSFEIRIKDFDGVVVNATEGGLAIEGARTMRFADFMEEYCDVSHLDTFDMLAVLAEARPAYDLDGLLEHVRKGKATFRKIRNDAARIIKLMHELKILREKHLLRSPKAAEIIEKMEELEGRIENPILRVVSIYRYRLENYLKLHEVGDDETDIFEEPLGYYDELINVIDSFIVKLDRLIGELSREKTIDGLMKDASVPDIAKLYKMGMLYKEAGVLNRAAEHLEKAATKISAAVNMESAERLWPQIRQVYVALVETYLNQYRFYEVREILQTITNLCCAVGDGYSALGADEKIIMEWLRLCDEKIYTWEEQERKMGLLLRQAEVNYGGQLETGSFYFRLKDYEMAERAYKRVISDVYAPGDADEGVTDQKVGFLPSPDDCLPIIMACYGLAHAYLAMGDKEKALNALDKGSLHMARAWDCEIIVQVEEMCRLLTNLYVECQKIDKAISLYETVVSLNPTIRVSDQAMAMLQKETAVRLEDARQIV
ncbi:MAG: Tetratricopeptide repeat protein [Syntrophorhabdus sp. PtaU1.Bin002]|nr:MAG: Tetratricopeptide repeat protein [Syntrophorhabdus sp. PtaU1.Bin002]